MSRIGKLPITLPQGVEVKMDGNKVSVKGPNGVLEETFSPEITIKLENGIITVERPSDEPRIRLCTEPRAPCSTIWSLAAQKVLKSCWNTTALVTEPS